MQTIAQSSNKRFICISFLSNYLPREPVEREPVELVVLDELFVLDDELFVLCFELLPLLLLPVLPPCEVLGRVELGRDELFDGGGPTPGRELLPGRCPTLLLGRELLPGL